MENRTVNPSNNPFELLSEQIHEISLRLDRLAANTNTKSEQPILLSAEEVLELLKVSRPTLRNWEQKNKLRPIRIGRRLLFKMEDLHELLK